jgi:thiamine-phosphate pyrophosphorylase
MGIRDQVRLMVLTDALLWKGRDAVELCRAAVSGGATAIQVRVKPASPLELAELGRSLVAALPVPVLINDRVDVALAIGAAGAHLGQDDPPLDVMRSLVPPGFLLGISVGSAEEAARVAHWPADYWSIGPCFATAHKSDAGPPLGAGGFAALARRAPAGMPVIGIGGITAANAAEIARAGAAGVAVIGAVWGGDATDPTAAARALRSAIA